MGLKLLDELQTTQGERVVGRCKLVTDWSPNENEFAPIQHQYNFTTKAEFWFQQTGPESAFKDMHRQAKMALARNVYGEIESDLLDVLEKLWEEGFQGDDDLVIMVDKIIMKCRGQE